MATVFVSATFGGISKQFSSILTPESRAEADVLGQARDFLNDEITKRLEGPDPRTERPIETPEGGGKGSTGGSPGTTSPSGKGGTSDDPDVPF